MAYYLKNKNREVLTVGTPKNVGLLLWVAEQKGFFADRGLHVRIMPVPYSRRAMELMLDKKIDMAALVETNVAYLGYINPEMPYKCIASIEKRTGDSILLRHEKNEKPAPQDLKGKKIGFVPRTTSHSFMMRFLEHYQIKKSDIRLKPLNPQTMPAALIRGDVDAISLWEAHITNTTIAMDELGLCYTCFENPGFYASEVALATSKNFLVKNQRRTQNLMLALRDAENFIKSGPDETARLLAGKLNLKGRDFERALKSACPALNGLGEDYMKNIQFWGQWIGENDTEFRGQPLPDYDDYMDNSVFLDLFPEEKV